MDLQNVRLLLMLLPRLPLIARITILHLLHLSESSKYLDLRSTLTVGVLRSFMTPTPGKPRSISAVQKLTLRDPGVKGRIWVATYTAPEPVGSSVRDILHRALKDLRDPGLGAFEFDMPELKPVEAEWTGYRKEASADERPPDVSEQAKYQKMMEEVTSPTTILYLHGGAYYLCDPATHRATSKKLAKITGGRSYSVRYRLAPQAPFPSALLDALVSYLTLLYPPEGAWHDPVRPENIAMAGDSAGGNLVLALLQLILHLQRTGQKVFWQGEERDVPVPSCVACNSPWLDITQSSPSWEGTTPAPWDYLPKPEQVASSEIQPCPIWPATPERKHLYVADDLITHPLASVVVNSSWKGAPPVYMCTGWEILALEDKYFAKKLESEGVTVVFEEYEAMPHCFAMILDKTANAARCYDGWGGFIRTCTTGGTVESSAVEIKAKTGDENMLAFDKLSNVKDEDMVERVQRKGELLAKL